MTSCPKCFSYMLDHRLSGYGPYTHKKCPNCAYTKLRQLKEPVEKRLVKKVRD